MVKKDLTLGIIIDTALKIPPNTGVTYRLYYLSKKLVQKGINIKIFVCNRNFYNNEQIKELLKEKSLEFHVIPEFIFYNTEKLGEIIKKGCIDILQVEDSVSVIRYEKIAKDLNVPICLEMHDVEATLLENLKYEKKQIASSIAISHLACILSKKIICMTPLDRYELINKIGVDIKKLSLIPNPIDLIKFPYYGSNFKEKNVVFLGNMFYWPNQNAAKFIAQKLYPQINKNFKGIRFTFIGMVPENIKKRFSKNNLIFSGSATGKNLNQLLKKSTIALCPVIEGSGMKVKILNYCAAGLPIITTQIGASGYEKITSLIVENNLDKYQKIIIDLLNNPNRMKLLGEKNRFFVKKYYSLDRIANMAVQTYQDVIKNFHYRKTVLKTKKQIEPPLPLWLQEKRTKANPNKNYYLIKNGKILLQKRLDRII